MNEELQEFVKQVLANPCGWTTGAKMMWLGLGVGLGVVVSVVVTYLFRRQEKQ